MPWASFEGAGVEYYVDGQGPPLVLIHGTGGDAVSNWRFVVDRLSRNWTIIRPNYSGSGGTRDDGRPLTLDYLAGQVLAAARHAGADGFHLVGFSLGAAVAARLAARHPEHVRALVLLAGLARADARLKLEFELWKTLIRTDRRAMMQLILLTGFSPDYISALGEHALGNAVEEALPYINWDGMLRQTELDLVADVTADLRRIVAPTLSIGCTHDHMVPPSHARGLAAEISGASYAELPTGHISVEENAEAFLNLVEPFLDAHR